MIIKRSLRIKALILTVAFIAGLGIGTICSSSLPVIAGDLSSSTSQDNLSAPVFKVNQNGETYGSLMNVNTYGQEPDLILAQGVDGTIGYLKKGDMNLNFQPKTPEEALAFQKSMQNSPRIIPLYDVDGKTVIGKYMANSGQSFDIKE